MSLRALISSPLVSTAAWMSSLVQDSQELRSSPKLKDRMLQVLFSWHHRNKPGSPFVPLSTNIWSKRFCFFLTDKQEIQNSLDNTGRSDCSLNQRFFLLAPSSRCFTDDATSRLYFLADLNKSSPRFSFNRWLRFFNLTINEHTTPFFIWANTFA